MLRRLLLAALVIGCSRGSAVAPQTNDLALVRGSARELARFGRVVPAAPSVSIALASRSTASTEIALDAARALRIRATDVVERSGKALEGATVFASALPSTDVLLAREGDRFEEVRVMHDAAAPDHATWAIDAGDGIVDVRLERGQVQAFDRNGRIVLRSEPMFAVDAKGVRREPTVKLERAAKGFSLTATLDRTGLAYPIVLDPVWLPGPSGAMRSNHHAVRLGDGKVYVVGSSTKFEVFNPTTSSFSTLADCSDCYSVDAAFATSDNKVRIVANGTVRTYDPSTNAWTGGVGTGRLSFGASYTQLGDGSILAAGGNGSTSTFVDIYTLGTDTWTAKANLAEGRQRAMLAVLPSGKVWIAGGSGASTLLSTTELYDPTSNTWSSGPALTLPLWDAAVVSFAGGSVALFGGETTAGLSAKTVVYDSVGGTVKDGPSLAVARHQGAVALTPDSRIYVIGGSTGPETATDSVEVSAPLLGAFAPTAKLLFPRERLTATPLLDGRILVVGGNGGMLGGSPSSTEILTAFDAGVACTWGGECASGFCASGVCCNSACTGECQRCDLAGKKGQCSAAPATTECGAAATCTGSTLAARGRCNGVDNTCTGATPAPCAGALVCADAASCLAKCTKDADCTTSYCNTTTGLCEGGSADAGPAVAPVPEGAPKVLGSAQRCTAPSECASGFCVDGVCCDSECKDRCHSCALPSSPGRCAEEPLGVDLRAECGPALSCAGTCGKGGVCTTSVEGSQCKPSVCTSATKGRGAAICKARGVMCNADEGVEFDCGAYACDPAFGACRTSCTASDACAPGFTCNLTAKSCDRLPESEEEGCAVTRVGTQGRAAFGLAIVALALAGRARRRRR